MLPHLHKVESVIFLRTDLGITSCNRGVGEYEISEPYDCHDNGIKVQNVYLSSSNI